MRDSNSAIRWSSGISAMPSSFAVHDFQTFPVRRISVQSIPHGES